jgi:2,3-bisphosphoglycerate-independent phosphoglycerate mutase
MERVVLCIVAGLGARAEREGNAMAQAETPVLDALRARHPHTTLAASGEAVGLREGDVGNSEAGYLTIGAGRAVAASRHKLDETIARRKLAMVPIIDQTIRICMIESCRLHLVGLLSDAGVHSELAHLEALIETATYNDIPVRIHAILDGRDVPARSATRYLERLELALTGDAKIATVSGRGYAMACDGRWDLTYQAFHAIVRDKILGPSAPQADSWFDAIQLAYGERTDDAWIRPTRIGDYQGIEGDFLCDFGAASPSWEWTGKEAGIAFNLRGDRMRQLTAMLTRRAVPDEVLRDLLVDRDKAVRAFEEHAYATLTDHGDDLALPVAFPRELVDHTLGHALEGAGATHLRCGETEAEHSFTASLSGRRSQPFAGEARAVVRSPRLVDRWTDRPAMSTAQVARRAVEAIQASDHPLVVVDFVAPDALAHSGDLAGAVAAIEAVDAALGEIAEAARSAGATLIVTSTHGNAEEIQTDEGKAHPGHTRARVPFLYARDDATLREDGSLADVAPTILELLGIAPPAAMTGRSLRVLERA